MKKTRKNKNLEPRSDSIGSEKALAAAPDQFRECRTQILRPNPVSRVIEFERRRRLGDLTAVRPKILDLCDLTETLSINGDLAMNKEDAASRRAASINPPS